MAPSRQLLLEEENAIVIDCHNCVCNRSCILVILIWLMIAIAIHETQKVKLPYREKRWCRLVNLNNLIIDSNATCKSKFRINRYTFHILREMLRDIGGFNQH